ncbi:MAG: porin [Hydrogenophaga sp.]|jgi:predicted porin|uniref:porin n=1 Tax=Hydrogenophaga sp. TaxID=1904254 RepID=UPI0040355519
MKKSLIALAVLGSVAGVAQAQSSVTMYGLVDVWAGRVKTEVPGVGSVSSTRLDSAGLATSRWGVQGSEDLGGGLKAIFKLEQGFDASNGTAVAGTAFNRQSWVGLEGGFGTVQFGNVWSAFDDVFYIGNSIFDAVSFSPAYAVMSVAAYNDKPRNALRYTSPNFGGFSAAVSHGLDENAAVKRDQTDFNLQYAAGPLTAAFAYQLQNDAAGVGQDAKFTYFTAAYDLGVAVLKGGVGQTRNVFATKTNDWQIGADFPLSSALTLSTGYASSKDKDGTDTKRTGYSVGALYALSKRTSTYAAFTKAKEEVAGTTAVKGTVFGVGLQHKF